MRGEQWENGLNPNGKYGYGTCAVCGARRPLTSKGKIYNHQNGWISQPLSGFPRSCKGSGKVPSDGVS